MRLQMQLERRSSTNSQTPGVLALASSYFPVRPRNVPLVREGFPRVYTFGSVEEDVSSYTQVHFQGVSLVG